jgi:hypothetical protein
MNTLFYSEALGYPRLRTHILCLTGVKAEGNNTSDFLSLTRLIKNRGFRLTATVLHEQYILYTVKSICYSP